MSRIEGVTEKQASPLVRVIYRLARHEIRKLTGQRDRLTGDIPIRAHRPRTLIGYGMLEKAVASKPLRGRAPARAGRAQVGGDAGVRDVPGHRLL